jgi:hypothetical protein
MIIRYYCTVYDRWKIDYTAALHELARIVSVVAVLRDVAVQQQHSNCNQLQRL